MLFVTKSPVKCSNCERLLSVGETVHAEDQAAQDRGAAVCSNCRPAPKEEKPAKKAAE